MKKSPLRIIFFGTPAFVVSILDALEQHFTVVAVVTKSSLTQTPIQQNALDNNIIILTPQQFTSETLRQLQALESDLFVVAAYGKILPKIVLDLPRYGSINIHPSLLPKYRGPTPIQSAIFHGDEVSGISIIKMDEEVDHGSILSVKEIKLSNKDTFAYLSKKMFQETAAVLPRVIDEYVREKIIPLVQDEKKATYCDHITKDHGFFDLENPPSPEKLDRMIRAYYPWPGVWSKIMHKGQEVRIKFLPEGKIQMQGKNPVSYNDFFNGYPELKEKLLGVFPVLRTP